VKTMLGDGHGTAPVVVIGIGNVLLGDDGFGPTVIGMLAAQWELAHEVELIDAGTPGLDLAGRICGRDSVILIDAVAGSGEGIRVYRGEDLQRVLALRPRVSEHDPALAEALAIAGLVGDGPHRVVLVGVSPETCDVGVGLSARIEAAARQATDAVIATLAEWGFPARRRELVNAPKLWWASRCETDDKSAEARM